MGGALALLLLVMFFFNCDFLLFNFFGFCLRMGRENMKLGGLGGGEDMGRVGGD